MKLFGLRLHTARKILGLNQYQLSAEYKKRFKITVSHMKISRWELGYYPIDVLELYMHAQITGQPIDYYFKD